MPTSTTRRQVRERVVQLSRTAHEAYHASEFRFAARSFARVRELAESIDDRVAAIEARFWEGASLDGAGRVREAMALLAPAMSTALDRSVANIVYRATTRFLVNAIALPLPFAKVERALSDAEHMLGGLSPRRVARLLLARARLAAAQGRFRSALALSQEGLERWRVESATFTLTTHMRTLVDSCIKSRETNLARSYLEEWELKETAHLQTKRVMIACHRSTLARLEGRADDANTWAERAAAEADHRGDHLCRVAANESLLRARLSTGNLSGARAPLAELFRWRHAPIGQDRFSAWLLCGDFYLGRARTAAGLAPTYFEDSKATACLVGNANTDSGSAVPIGADLKRARRAYGHALRRGRRLDRLLGCGYWVALLAERRCLLHATEHEIG